MAGRSDLVDISCTLVYETDKAWRINDGSQTVWVPKSLCELSEPSKNGLRELTIPEWLAMDKGLI